MADSPHTCFQLEVSLQGMKPEDSLQIVLPLDYAQLGVWDLLESVFPAEGTRQAEVEAKLDLRENPDLPEIFDVLLDAFAQWRLGYCTLNVSTHDGTPLDPSDQSQKYLKLLPSKAKPDLACPALHLVVEQEYRAMDYAVQQGYWETRQELLEWLQTLTLLYFLDKHELEIPAIATPDGEQGLLTIANVLYRENLAVPLVETGMITITESYAVIGFVLLYVLRLLIDLLLLPSVKVSNALAIERNVGVAFIESTVVIGAALILFFAI